MGEHTGKQFVYLSQKQGRNARPERKGMGVLSQCGHPAAERSTEVIVIPSIGQAFRVFVYLWPTTSFLFSHLTGPWILPITCAQLFCWDGSQRRGLWSHVHTYCEVAASPFSAPKEPSCACADREVFLDLRRGHLISLLQQSSASDTSFVLGVYGWEQSFNVTPLDKHQLSGPGAHLSPTSALSSDFTSPPSK